MSNKNNSFLKPVEKIELDDRHMSKRLWLVLALLAIGVIAIGVSVNNLFKVDEGYRQVSAVSSIVGCDTDFEFMYCPGSMGISPRVELKRVINLYTDACETAYRQFSTDQDFGGIHNLRYINSHPNEDIVVSEVLYNALKLVSESGNRSVFLAPLLVDYQNLFLSDGYTDSSEFDPYENEELRAFCAEVAAFARSQDDIEIILLDNLKVRLKVSESYLAYAKAGGIKSFIDLYTLKNAFSVDYIASRLSEEGYTYGFITSYDGYIRNFDSASGTDYTLNVFDLADNTLLSAAAVRYAGGTSIVYLHDFPIQEYDALRFYRNSDGSFKTPYIDTSDGLCKSAVSTIIGGSKDLGCAEIALRLLPIMSADSLDEALIGRLEDDGITSLVMDNRVIRQRGGLFDVYKLYNADGISYKINKK